MNTNLQRKALQDLRPTSDAAHDTAAPAGSIAAQDYGELQHVVDELFAHKPSGTRRGYTDTARTRRVQALPVHGALCTALCARRSVTTRALPCVQHALLCMLRASYHQYS